ncbi:uncharacterized protein MEPE_05400 [Melanopsichium pennsylvanicum]|uniref:Tyrosinase copper-binding domain-containing protein n=1 Tax=Melanopsichium pennsylvanicum TaxID=63383 RepID=A0AAJ4XRR1_9BASI|nr:uncharacterized protein MEPE_05400 [Melanopsichium pennsylvanicum]
MKLEASYGIAVLSLLLSLTLFPVFVSAESDPTKRPVHHYRHRHLHRASDDLTQPEGKTSHLLHCLGTRSRADQAKVESLLQANPNIPAEDDQVWLSLGPKEWGFKGHDTSNGNTWDPVQGAAQTAKDRVQRQRLKLKTCANKLKDDFEKQQSKNIDFPLLDDEQNYDPNRKTLPNMWGGEGFKSVKQGGDDFFLRQPATPQKNDSQVTGGGIGSSTGTNPSAENGAANTGHLPDQDQSLKNNYATSPPEVKKDVAGTSNPGTVGQKPGSDSATAPGTKSPDTSQSSTILSTGDHVESGQKFPTGTGSDQKSVAPALEKDSQQKNLLSPASAAGVAAGDALLATDPKDQSTTHQPKESSQSVGLGLVVQGTASQNGNVTQSTTRNNAVNADDLKSLAPGTTMPGQIKLATDPNDVIDPTRQSNDGTTPPPGSTCGQIRIRKEYSSLTRQEKKLFADAMKCVRQQPSRFRSGPEWNAADDWTLLHIRMVKYVHFTAYFSVFHRGFIAIVERDLNNCGFGLGLPWVDWTKTSEDPSRNAVFDADPEYGLGTNGQGDNQDCPWGTGFAVTDGALSNHFFNAPFRHRLCRQFNNMNVDEPNPHFGNNCTTFINAKFVKGLGATHDDGKFFDFSSALEISTHLAMHTCIGGNLAWLSSSPNDMTFHFHHTFVDNVFSAWQNKNSLNKVAFHGPKDQQKNGAHPPWTAKKEDVINFSPLADNIAVQDLLDITSGNWNGMMCYQYDYSVDM